MLARVAAAVVLCTCVSTIRSAEPEAPVELKLDPAFADQVQIPAAPEIPSGEKKPDIFYLPTPQRVVDAMLLMAEVNKHDVLYDLGSGDGRLVITAAKRYGAHGIGIEIDPKLLAEANKNARAAKVQDKVEFRQQDLFTSDFSDASVITLYLLDTLNERLRPRILAQVKPGTRIVSHAFRMGEWEPDQTRTLKIEGTDYNAFFWVVPANVSGRWRIAGNAKPKGMPESVTIEQTFQRFTVRRSDNNDEIGAGSVNGTEFVMMMRDTPDAAATSFIGTIDGNSIKATASNKRGTWRGEREAGSEKLLDPGS